jgi:hypothetical protein
MDPILKDKQAHSFYTETDFYIGVANQNQPSRPGISPVISEEVSAYANELKLQGDQVADTSHTKQVEERQVTTVNTDRIIHDTDQKPSSNPSISPASANNVELQVVQLADNPDTQQAEVTQAIAVSIDDILQKVSYDEVIKAKKNSKLTKSLPVWIDNVVIASLVSLIAAGIAILPSISSIILGAKGLGAISIHILQFVSTPTFEKVVLCSLIIAGCLFAIAVFCALTTSGLKRLEFLNELHYENLARYNLLIRPMLDLMKGFAEKDEELKKLLSETRSTDNNIKNIVDTTKKLYDKAKKVGGNVLEQQDLLNNLNKKIENNQLPDTSVEPDEENKKLLSKLKKIEQQTLEAEEKLKVAAQELLCSLINNLCVNFSENKDTQDKIKASFLKCCDSNLNNSKEALRYIVSNYFDLSEVDEKIYEIIDIAIDRTISIMREELNAS